jgi:hypothetical protein
MREEKTHREIELMPAIHRRAPMSSPKRASHPSASRRHRAIGDGTRYSHPLVQLQLAMLDRLEDTGLNPVSP